MSPLLIPVPFLHAGHLRESPLLRAGPKSFRLVTTSQSAPFLSGVPSAVPVYSAVLEFILYRSSISLPVPELARAAERC